MNLQNACSAISSWKTSNAGPWFQHVVCCQSHICARKVPETRGRLWLCAPHAERVPPADGTAQETHTFRSQPVPRSQAFGFSSPLDSFHQGQVTDGNYFYSVGKPKAKSHDSVISKNHWKYGNIKQTHVHNRYKWAYWYYMNFKWSGIRFNRLSHSVDSERKNEACDLCIVKFSPD